MSELQSLFQKRTALDAEINKMQLAQKSETIALINNIMDDYNLSTDDLAMHVPKKAKTKYRNYATNEAWSGRGLTPVWVKRELAAGALLEDFLIEK